MNSDQIYEKEIFLQKIKQMEDRDLLLSYTRKADYQPLFSDMVEEELALRGYDVSELEYENIDSLIIKRKETDDLVKIFTVPDDYPKGWGDLAKKELEKRKFDISSLFATAANNKKMLISGKQGRYIILGYIFSFLGGVVGLCFGFNYVLAKRSSVSGESYPKYNKNTRNHGKIMLILSFVSIILQIILRKS
ncbi:MAG: hypothetical protein LKI53_09100 [Bacteroidales bacterium]|jgi:hypothetical protein|nr:hypothetical protein [Bacteroidales bacterium]